MNDCPFCMEGRLECIWEDSQARALLDAFPVSEGHTLIVPRRHVARFHDLDETERASLMRGVEAIWPRVRGEARDFNLGLNDGPSAGQTVSHVHLHVIPRRPGDTPDPVGGVRGVIPERRDWRRFRSYPPSPRRTLIAGPPEGPLQDALLAALDTAQSVDMAIAFVTEGGLDLVRPRFEDVLSRPGGRVRLVTGDYLGFNEPSALRRLLEFGDSMQVFIHRSAGEFGFHGKAYIVQDRDGRSQVFLGSSNLTRSALRSPFEWNLCIDDHIDPAAVRRAREEFSRLVEHSRTNVLDQAWIAEYERVRKDSSPEQSRGVDVPAPPADIVEAVPSIIPTEVQKCALEGLAAEREAGGRSGLVVMATGLGKTYLAALHRARQADRTCLFVAHRTEILSQAMAAFRRVDPAMRAMRLGEGVVDDSVDVVFASIQSLSRPDTLRRFAPSRFDLVVVDEFHHALAPTYRRVIDHFTPRFLLGLTATPERGDRGEILALCGDRMVYRCDLFEGIERALLSPFDYFGIADEVDYEQIPWRNGRFDEESLDNQIATDRRAARALEEWLRRIGLGRRTLGFCASIRHAEHMRRFLEVACPDIRCAAVHGGDRSDARQASLDALRHGELDLLLSVDMFNEGVDLPEVDGVLMLRPTTSPVIFLQQLGRGLRRREGKRLTVVDFVGNHRSFLTGLLSLLGSDSGEIVPRLAAAAQGDGAFELPAGCRALYDLKAIDFLRRAASARRVRVRLQDWYEDHCDRTGARPTFREAIEAGYFGAGGGAAGMDSWIEVLARNDAVPGLLAQGGDVVREVLEVIQTTTMTRSFKMLVLELFAEELLPAALPMARIEEHFRRKANNDSRVRSEISVDLENAPALRDYIRRNPIAAWTSPNERIPNPLFKFDGDALSLARDIPDSGREAVADLMLEFVEARLWSYFNRRGRSA